jgi:hypothetical protein
VAVALRRAVHCRQLLHDLLHLLRVLLLHGLELVLTLHEHHLQLLQLFRRWGVRSACPRSLMLGLQLRQCST